jgi:hypothetical protein
MVFACRIKIWAYAAIILLLAGCVKSRKEQLTLFDPMIHDIALVKSFSGDEISREDGWIKLDFTPGHAVATLAFYPSNDAWDASDFRFVRCEIQNLSTHNQLVELGFGEYDLTLGAVLIPPQQAKTLKAIIYRTDHEAYIDTIFPTMHGKPDGILRGWMASTSTEIEYIKLLFNHVKPGESIRIGRIWLEEAYELLSGEELIEKFYPFVDQFGQNIHADWQGKIHSFNDLKKYGEEENQDLLGCQQNPEWNKYGGWNHGPRLESTGRFRVEKVKGKWWLIDPDGKLFWSQGIDCVEFGRQTQTRISGREHYFSYLPEDKDSGAQLYATRESTGDSIQWLSFHALNLFRKYGESWKEISNEKIHDRLYRWGMNTIGNWSDNKIYLLRKTPYVLTINTKRTGLLADPYCEGYQEDLEEKLILHKEERNDPWCIGVFVDNELKWGVKWAAKIPEQIQTAPEDQPAKVAFKECMVEKYGTIDALNLVWRTAFSDWDDFLKNRDVIPEAADDMRTFMKEFASKYFSLCSETVKKVDPDMLYLGCRMDFHLYPEDTTLNYIIKIAAKYCDVVSFNRYRYTCSELIPPDGGDYPILIGEFHFGSLETGLLQPGLRYAADPIERAQFYENYVTEALTNPYIVGTHWFQLVDQAITGRPDGENYQAGFLTVGDVPQKEIIEKSKKLGNDMYHLRYEDLNNQ